MTTALAPDTQASRSGSHRFPRLSRKGRKALLLFHVLSSVSWIGVDLAMGVLAYRGLATDDPAELAVIYRALEMFCVPLLLTLGLLSLGSGIWLGLGTRFGLVRYWWVLVKLAISLVLLTLVLVALRPTLLEGAAQATVVDDSLPERLTDVRRNMLFPPVVSTTMLAFVTWLAVYKPWGVTPRGRRFLTVGKQGKNGR
ncbi:MAG TPA: DUF2269 family protein [Nocardioides sp.]|jgi:hypothetical protein|nr:DUF2269 family protein [Nocardioides sp.]